MNAYKKVWQVVSVLLSKSKRTEHDEHEDWWLKTPAKEKGVCQLAPYPIYEQDKNSMLDDEHS